MHISVKVTPKASRESVEALTDGTFSVRVKEKPEQGAANERVRELLAEYFGVSSAKVKLVQGFRARRKLFAVEKNIITK